MNKKKYKILIVDDEKTAHQLYKLMLKPEGYELLHAENGLEAVEMFSKHSDINLILMDIKMPIMDGYQASERIRKNSKKVIIIAQTAYAMVKDKEKAFAVGCNEHLAKPIQKTDLVKIIKKYYPNE
ncbi:MAG: response regulator [Bacteroidia bacterium]|nr:MAG: response regulator [Bacteroidia bacterium]